MLDRDEREIDKIERELDRELGIDPRPPVPPRIRDLREGEIPKRPHVVKIHSGDFVETRSFLRSRHRIIGGVVAGIGRYFGVYNPFLSRCGVVVLALLSGQVGLFIALYGLLWLVMDVGEK